MDGYCDKVHILNEDIKLNSLQTFDRFSAVVSIVVALKYQNMDINQFVVNIAS